MKKGRFSEDQMVRILREADQKPVAEVAKKHGVSEQTIYTWRKKFGELDVTDVRHLKQLERENARLKKLLAERDLEILEGLVRNPKRTYRIYAEEGLQVRRKKRKKLTRPRVPMAMPTQRNERWSIDFVSDQLATGRRFRVLNICVPGLSPGLDALL